MRSSAVSTIYGAEMHPNRTLWVPNPKKKKKTEFIPKNIHKN